MIDPINPDYTYTPASPRRPYFAYALTEPSALPCVTIVTPFYNTGPLFHDTARSVFLQSLQQWEWLIVNDSSTLPESLATLANYRYSDPRLRIIDHETTQGLSTARNTGFRQARASYVVQLDSDDLLETTAVEKWLWFLTSYPEFAFVKGHTVGFGAQEYLGQQGLHDGDTCLDENLVPPTSMIRTTVHQTVGGYDEHNRSGLADWEFWLRCASQGYRGGTVPEYLDWDRRRPVHSDSWTSGDRRPSQRTFQASLRLQYTRLWDGGGPQPHLCPYLSHAIIPDALPCENRLRKAKPRLLLLLPWLTLGGADKFNLDMLEQLARRGWEVTVATTMQGDHSWLPLFARYTPDIFILHHFLRLVDYPRFLRYLIQSRQVDVVMVSHSEMSYRLLPYLRAYCPEVTFIDFCHIEEYWTKGGYPQMAIAYQRCLDLNLVASEHLQRWMAQHGADPQRIRVCYINVDVEKWHPDPQQRMKVRWELDVEDGMPIVLYAGRLCAQKQPRVFAHTMRLLSRMGVPFVTLVAGDGPDLEWLREFVRRHQLDQWVRLLGAVPNERIRDLMTAVDVFFLPSEWEGIALSIYEAMACGLPVVGADVGGQRELVTPECGVLLARSDTETEAERYGKVLADLLTNPQRRQQMGQSGRVRVEAHFRLEQMAERMIVLLEEAMWYHATQPRPMLSPSLGRVCANQTVEYFRLSEVSDALWWAHEQHRMSNSSWRTLVYFAVKRRLLPYYRAGLSRDMTWLMSLKNTLKRALLR